MRIPLIAANFKMNGDGRLIQAHLDRLISQDFSKKEVALCPPFVYLEAGKAILANSPLSLGAQDVSNHSHGAFTGQISAEMLDAFGCKYVIIGHSERRALNAETNDLVAEKAAMALGAALTPILCVGETEFQREQGQTEQTVLAQVDAVLSHVGHAQFAKLVIAYEPVWAIGTGKAASPEDAQAVHQAIRSWLTSQDSALENVRILYGGSMNESNAQSLLAQNDIDGGLIGGASLKPEAFAQIVSAAS